MRSQPTFRRDDRGHRLAVAGALSAGACVLVVWSAWTTDTRLGAPLYWAWILTGLQVVALWAAGRKQWWAWLLGAGVQPVWIVYALVTGQVGFVPGCVISAAVQVYNFLRQPSRDPEGPRRPGSPMSRARLGHLILGWRARIGYPSRAQAMTRLSPVSLRKNGLQPQ